MANTFYIRVVVDPSGAARGTAEVGKHLEEMNKRAEKSFNLLRAYFAFNMAQNVAGKVIDVVDAYTSLENKVRSATSTQEEFDYAMQKIPEVARRSRGDLEAVGKAYQALTLSTQSMGLSQDQVLRMVETLQKSMIVSGSTSEEAASVMLQFSQALRKGKLDGDEFRSIMENNIEVQKLLANAMGISTDQLVGMSHAGKITRDVMVKALLEGAEAIDEKFGRTIPTISEQITLFKNEMILLAGEFNKSAHLGELFALMFQKVTEYAKTAVTVIGGLVGVVVDLENKLNKATGGGSRQVMGVVEEVASTITSPLKQVEYLIKGYDELRAHSERLNNEQLRDKMGGAGLLLLPPQFDEQVDQLQDAREELDLVTLALQKAAKSQGFLSLMGDIGLQAKDRADDLRDMAEAINLVNDALVRAGQASNLVQWLGGTGEQLAAQEQGLRNMAAAVESVNDTVARANAVGAFADFANQAQHLGNVFEAVVTGKPLSEVYAASGGKGQSSVIDAFVGKVGKKGPKDTFPDELKRLRGSIDSVWEAYNKLAEAKKTLDKGVERHLITQAEENRLLGLYTLQLRDALDPAQKFIDNIKEEAFYTRLRVQYTNEDSWAAEVEYRKEIVELQKLGLTLSREEFFAADRQRHQSEKLAEAARKMDDDKQALLDGLGIVSRDDQFYKQMAKLQRRTGVIFDNKGAATGNEDQLKQYLDGLAELQKQDRAGAFAPKFLEESDIYAQKIDMLNEAVASNKLPMELYGQALHKIDEDMGLVYDKSIKLMGIQEGLADGWRKINEQTADLATTVSTELVNAFDRMTDAIVEFVTTGKFSWDSFIQSLLAGVARIATQYLLLQILGMFGNSGTGGFNIVGGPGGGLIGDGLLEPTFAARGLDGVVRGQSGNDTNFLPLMVSNGERVTVTPAGQQNQVSARGGDVKVINIYEDRGAQIALMQSPAQERAVLNHLRRNPALARGLR